MGSDLAIHREKTSGFCSWQSEKYQQNMGISGDGGDISGHTGDHSERVMQLFF